MFQETIHLKCPLSLLTSVLRPTFAAEKKAMARFIRRGLKGPLTLEQIEENEKLNSWDLVHLTPAVGPNSAREMVWSMGDQQNIVHYVEDPLINQRYFLIEGPAMKKNLSMIEKVVPLYQPKNLLRLAASDESPKNLIPLLPKIAVSAPEAFDAEIFRILSQAGESESANLRYEALVSMAFVAWKEFEPVISKSLNHPEKDVADLAAFLLAKLKKEIWENSEK